MVIYNAQPSSIHLLIQTPRIYIPTQNMIDKYIYIILILASLALWARQKIIQKRKNPCGAPYPPGPRPLPFVGNVLDIPSTDLWVKAQEWGKTYGMLVLFLSGNSDFQFFSARRSRIYHCSRKAYPICQFLRSCSRTLRETRHDLFG